LIGPLQVEALRQALHAILARHESLRTTFMQVDGVPLQVIGQARPVQWTVVNLETVEATARETETRHLLQEESERPFDLSRDLMLRSTLIRRGPEDHVLLIVMHHIASDGWSQGVLFEELRAFYTTFTTGKPVSLPELPVQYADYAVWQRGWLTGEVLKEQLGYWKQRLGGQLPVLDLPSDWPRPAVPSYRGGRVRFELGGKLSRQLKGLSRQQRVTLFMTLLAAFQVLLYRYTGQTDLVVGTPIAGRTRRELEGLIGFFVNTLVLRTDLSGEPSFHQLLGRVREVALEAYSHQELPFEKLVEELQPERDLSRNPLFQVMFVLQNAPGRELELAGLEVSPLEVETGTAKFDLTLSLTDREEGLAGVLEYSADLWERETVERLAGHYRRLLEGVVADGEERISRLPLLTPAERQQVVVEWNRTERDYPAQSSVAELFERQAEGRPEAEAVVYEGERWSYGELNGRANQLAHYLRQLGVGPEVRVGICLERSLELVAGLLGILKAGGAYVPLDPAYPSERLAYMVEDAGVEVLLTHERLLGSLPTLKARVVCLDRDWGEVAGQPSQNPGLPIEPDHLAYVIYTSGSTGQPKGVAIPHRGIVRLLFGVDYVELGPSERLLHWSSISFDASTFELWGALLRGGCSILYPERIPTLESLGRLIRKQRISTLWLTSALFNLIVDEMPEILRGVRQLLVGGEAVSAAHVRRAYELLPSTQIINGYGPTESTTFTCCYPIPKTLRFAGPSVPIGRPIANTTVYILDAQLNPVPVGVPGELYIGGHGLAKGYLNRPELNSEKFIPDPFQQRAQGRMYRTGDIVRYRVDGNIDFLGRRDQQVKIRGFRVELEEIEAVLLTHPAIANTAVVVQEEETRGKRLVGYFVRSAGTTVTEKEILEFLRIRLPDFMIPSVLKELPSIPLTPNGKVDRRALPKPEAGPGLGRRKVTPPRTPVEEVVANIWTEVLKVPQVGVEENFFELGGHSLLATQAISRIGKALHINLPLRLMFEFPTVGTLALAIVERLSANRDETEVLRFLDELETSY
jgi:aspartate racemase